MGSVPTPESDRARFWAKVDKNGPVVRPELGPCWLWTAATFDNGYGAFRLGGKQRRAHVVSHEWHVGPVPTGLSVLHHCDIRRCIRSEHLFTGTQKDNIQDAVSKQRMASGRRNGMHTQGLAILTDDQVREIHALCSAGAPQWAVAEQYGVTQTMVSRILRGIAWAHLNLPVIRTEPKVTAEQVTEIRRLFAAGVSRQDIAARFFVSLGCVDKIHHRRTWRHLP